MRIRKHAVPLKGWTYNARIDLNVNLQQKSLNLPGKKAYGLIYNRKVITYDSKRLNLMLHIQQKSLNLQVKKNKLKFKLMTEKFEHMIQKG